MLRGKSQWSSHSVVFFNLLMLVVTKGHTYIKKSGSLSYGSGGGGGDLPCPFLKIEKSALILEKKFSIVSILKLNLPFKM